MQEYYHEEIVFPITESPNNIAKTLLSVFCFAFWFVGWLLLEYRPTL